MRDLVGGSRVRPATFKDALVEKGLDVRPGRRVCRRQPVLGESQGRLRS